MIVFLALVSLALADPTLAQNGGIAPPDTASPSGDAINEVYWVVFAICAVVFLAVESTLILFVIRYRRRKGTPADAEGPQVYGNTRVEIVWTLVPALLLLILAIYTFSRVPDVEAKPGGGDMANVVTIEVTGHQFYWQYRYPNDALSYDELVLPLDRKVRLVLDSEDVNHSWWVPELTGKRDAIPGQTNTLYFTPHTEGVFENGVCGEFCGIQHARMTTRVEVVSEDEFDAWLEENAPGSDDVALGESQWEAACAKCHGLDGSGDIGPAIAGNSILTNPEALDLLVRVRGQNLPGNPGYMPAVGKGWTDEQLETLIAYVKSNEKLAGPGGGQDGG